MHRLLLELFRLHGVLMTSSPFFSRLTASASTPSCVAAPPQSQHALRRGAEAKDLVRRAVPSIASITSSSRTRAGDVFAIERRDESAVDG